MCHAGHVCGELASEVLLLAASETCLFLSAAQLAGIVPSLYVHCTCV